MEFDNSAQVNALAALPTEAPKPEPRSAWGAPWRAIKAGVAEVAGSLADVVKGYGAGAAIAAEADPFARAVLGDAAVERGGAQARQQNASDEALVSDVGRSFRNVAYDMRPDPATASTAEQIVFGLVRPLAKLGAGAALGPIGIGLASAEEGFTQAEDLRRMGVDAATRTKVGAVTALGTAAGAILPAAGSTVPRTLGLYVAGGPGGYVAQQAATREILASADYTTIAKQFDPLDPLGLTLSTLIPLPFAAYGLARNIRAGKAVSPEAVDAAMVHNLTVAEDARMTADYARAVAAQPDRSPVDVAVEGVVGDRVMEQNAGVPADTNAPGQSGDAQGANSGKTVAEQIRRALEEAWDGDWFGGAFGLRVLPPDFQGPTSVGSVLPNSFRWEDGNWTGDELDGVSTVGIHNGDIESALKIAQGTPAGGYLGDRVVLVAGSSGKAGEDVGELVIRGGTVIGEWKRDGRLGAPLIPNESRAPGSSGVLQQADLAARIQAQIDEIGTVIDAARVGRMTDPPQAPVRIPEEPPAVVAARQTLEQMRASGKSLDEFMAGANIPPEVRNLATGLYEAGPDQARAQRMTADYARAVAAQPDRSPVDVAADVVEASRQGSVLTPEPAPRPASQELAQSVNDRVFAIEQTRPDLPVGDETAADFMARIRKEAAEGTDADLGALDADLVRVAAECALMVAR